MPNIPTITDDDISGNYLQARQVAHEYDSPEVQGMLKYSMSSEFEEDVSKKTPEFKGMKPTKEQKKAEKTEGIQDPYLDPVSAAVGGFVGAGAMSVSKGLSLMPALGRALASGIVGGMADYPIGLVTEEVIEPKYPKLALPFNVITGMISGTTIEGWLEEAVIKGWAKRGQIIEKGSDLFNKSVADLKLRLGNEIGAISLRTNKGNLTTAYKALKSEKGYSFVEIADLRDRMGITQAEMETLIRENPERFVTSKGDWSLSDEHVRSGGVQLLENERPELLIKIKEGTKTESPSVKADDPTAEAFEFLNSKIKEDPVLQDLMPKPSDKTQEALAKAKGQAEPLTNEAMRADLTGSEETLPKYLGNINRNYLDTPDKIKSLINLNTQQFKAQFMESKRGTRTWEQTEREAKKYTLNDLLQRDVGQAYNAEQIENARTLVVSSSENLQVMREKIRVGTATENEKFEFMQAFSLHYAILEQISGIAGEAGRALNIFRKLAGSDVQRIKQIRKMMAQVPASPEELAEALSEMDSPIKVSKFVKGAMKSTTRDMFLEAWINGLLSGPHTHAVNVLSNSLVSVWQIPERFLAGAIGRVLPGEQVIKEREALMQAYGLFEGFKDGLKAFGKVIQTGLPTDEMSKIEATRYRAITAENFRQLPLMKLIKKASPGFLEQGGVAAKAVDLLGEGVRMPGRFLMAEDELFKGIGYRMELRALAYRTAMQEGLSGKTAANRMAIIMDNPDKFAPNIHLAAIDAARYQTFTGPLQSKILGALGSSNNVLLRMIVPFIRTPTNILKFAGERTPLAFLSSRIAGDIKAGGARRDLALARMSMGSMAMGIATLMAAEGKITGGGPSDPKLQANLKRQGWQPYSIKIGNKYVQYGRLEPVGMLFGLAADFAEISGLAGEEMTPETENIATAIIASISKNATSKTWLKGLSEAVMAMDDPDRYGSKYIQNYVGSMVPSISAQTERTIDPELEQVSGMMDAMKARIPGLSKDLPPRRDLWGKPMTTQIGEGKRSALEVAYSVISPVYISEGKDSPIDKELTRLKLGLEKPGKRQTILGETMELTPKEFDDYQVLMNITPIIGDMNLKQSLDDLVSKNPDYKDLSEEKKKDTIRAIMNKARDVGRARLLEKYPYLEDIAIGWKEYKMQGGMK